MYIGRSHAVVVFGGFLHALKQGGGAFFFFSIGAPTVYLVGHSRLWNDVARGHCVFCFVFGSLSSGLLPVDSSSTQQTSKYDMQARLERFERAH